jgi:hypothetical protein
MPYDLIRDTELAHAYMQHVIDLANTLHLNSFTYDFHLRHFLTYITDRQVAYPKFNFVDTLSAFSRFYPEPPGFARNHLIHRTLEIPLLAEVEDTNHFFTYLSRNASRYKLGNMEHRSTPPCVFLLSIKEGIQSESGSHTGVFGPEPFPLAPIAATEVKMRSSVSSHSPAASTRASQSSNTSSAPTSSSLVYLFLAVLSPPPVPGASSVVNRAYSTMTPSSLEAAVAALSPSSTHEVTPNTRHRCVLFTEMVM